MSSDKGVVRKNPPTEEDAAVKKARTQEAKTPTTNMAVDDDFVFPHDWPAPTGDIDLDVQDRPHATADTEWWYQNAHVKTKAGKQFSFFASFFRIVKEVKDNGEVLHTHALTWAIVDPEKKEYHCDPLLDMHSPEVLLNKFKDDEVDLDPRMRKAFIEVCNKGKVPLPDHLMTRECKVDLNGCNLDYDGNQFWKDENGYYHLKCQNKAKKMAIDVVLKPKKKVTRQGHNGVVKIGLKTDTMFYYFIPRCDVTGSITINNKKHVITGNGWYDHEFGGVIRNKGVLAKEEKERKGIQAPKQKTDSYAWNWLSVQLDDGTDLSATQLTQPKTGELFDQFVVTIGPNSEYKEYPDMEFTPSNTWTSTRTIQEYPLEWSLKVPSAELELELKAAFADQELVTLIAEPGFWEGRLHIKGTYRGKPVSGLGFLERHGHQNMSRLDSFFKRVSKITCGEIAEMVPLKPNFEEIRELIAMEGFDHFLDGANLDVFTDTVIKPIRDIVDRGGKTWRSYSFLLCIDAVGGKSQKYKHWLAMPELMHVGSLIVDDIQDKSETRRGGPTVHKMLGEAVAINSGTAAYFLSMHLTQARSKDMPDKMRLKLYELYFLTLRAGHAGQAFDIYGLDYMMEDVCEQDGKGAILEERVRCTHRLKSAVPAGNLARMGASLGGASDEIVEALGRYFEAIGVAFQIMDDVLNLRGFEGNVKNRGEDINAGKITYPVAKGMARMNREKRRKVWDIIKTKPQEQKLVDEVIAELDAVGAIDGSVEEATTMVNDAWKILDPLIEESFYKILLRAFGWYVLDRHY